MPSLSCLLAPSPIGYGSCPSLPSSPSSIAILGPGLPASSAVHLSLAHLGPGQRALILVKDVQAWTSCLLSDGPANDGDAWIRERAGRGEQARTLARVDVRACPTPAHAACLLANLDRDPQAVEGWSTILLLDPSTYYVDIIDPQARQVAVKDDDQMGTGEDGDDARRCKVREGVTASNYGSLVAVALSAVDQLNATRPDGRAPTRLILLDALASSLSFPILPVQPPKLTPGKRSLDGSHSKPRTAVDGSPPGPMLALEEMVKAMIDWVAVVDRVPPPAGPEAEEAAVAGVSAPPTHRLTCPDGDPAGEDAVWFREELVDWGGELGGSRGARGRWVWCKEDGSQVE